MSTNGYSPKLRHQPQPKPVTAFEFDLVNQYAYQAQLQWAGEGFTCSSTGDIKAATLPENPFLTWTTTSPVLCRWRSPMPCSALQLNFHPCASVSSKTTRSWVRVRCCWLAGARNQGWDQKWGSTDTPHHLLLWSHVNRRDTEELL